MTREA